MRSRLGAIALVLGIGVVGSTLATYAQSKEEDRVAGTVQLINKESKTILVSGEANSKQMQVAYDEKTRITMDNKAATIDDVQNGRRVICTGHNNKEGQLHAERCDVRPAN
jgi:hypothetical protein